MHEHIVHGGDTQGSEPSKYLQEEKSNEIPPVAASEEGRAQTTRACHAWGCRTRSGGATPCGEKARRQPKGLGRPDREGEIPVGEVDEPAWNAILSTAGHEESCRKQGGPPSKAEYSAATDSA